jgi:hypothetical protein
MTAFPWKSAAHGFSASSLNWANENELASLERDLVTSSPAALAMAASRGKWRGARHLMWLDQALLAAIDDAWAGHLDGLVVCLPPQHGKSELINLPALAEARDPLQRAPGEPLWPEVYSLEHLERIRERQTKYYWRCTARDAANLRRDLPQPQIGCAASVSSKRQRQSPAARCTLNIRSAPKIEMWGRGDAHKSPLPNGSPWRRLDGCDAGSERRAGVGMLSGRRSHDRGRRLTSVVHDTIFIIQGAALGMPGYRYSDVRAEYVGVTST